MDKRPISAAIIGSRGIPNRYGGFEACAEELGVRLVQRGHNVTVYTGIDHPVRDEYWKGVKRVMLPNPEGKLGTFGQFIYDFHCNRHTRVHDYDIVLHLGYTSDSAWYWLWTNKSVHIVNMDGQEWKRSKYNRAVRAFLRQAEKWATRRSAWLVADSPGIEEYLLGKYRLPVRYIAYGANIPGSFNPGLLAPWKLEPSGYDLVIARMEPENNIELVAEAKIASGNTLPLLIVGNANKFKTRLMEKYRGAEAIRFLDAVYEEDKVNALRHYSRLYVHGHSVGGTNPSLLEAMACGCRIVAHRNPFNQYVLGEKANYFSSRDELAGYFRHFNAAGYDASAGNNLDRVRREYNWDVITDAYEDLFYEAISNR